MKTNSRILLRGLAALLLVGIARGADTSITALPAISSVTSSTVLPVVDVSGTPTTKKATASQMLGGLADVTTSTRGIMLAADKLKLDNAAAAATASTLMLRDGSGNAAINVLTAASVTGLASPTNPTDAANKSYVDAAAAGLVIKTPGVAGTVGSNITLAGGAPTTLDGVTLHANDRVLVKDQTDNKENGIYFVQTLGSGSNGTWARTTDADTGAELVTGSYIFLTGGTINANAAYSMVTTGTITIGVSPIVWNLFSQVTQIQAANIIGQIVGSQVQDAAINTAKFALGIQPVSIVSALPSPSGYTGPNTVFNTSDSKLYRYTGAAFVATVVTTDLTGTITTTQIADNSISTPKLQANSVTATQIAANTITASQIAADTITAGQIAAGAINTSELAAGAVNASKIASNTITAGQIAANTITASQIAAGTITADRLNISSLSAISANIGTITAGTITGVSITATGSQGTITLNPTFGSILATNGSSTGTMYSWNPGTGSETHLTFSYGINNTIDLQGDHLNGGTAKFYDTSGNVKTSILKTSGSWTLTTDLIANNGNNGNYTIPMKVNGDNNLISFEYAGSNTLRVKIDSTVFTVALTP